MNSGLYCAGQTKCRCTANGTKPTYVTTETILSTFVTFVSWLVPKDRFRVTDVWSMLGRFDRPFLNVSDLVRGPNRLDWVAVRAHCGFGAAVECVRDCSPRPARPGLCPGWRSGHADLVWVGCSLTRLPSFSLALSRSLLSYLALSYLRFWFLAPSSLCFRLLPSFALLHARNDSWKNVKYLAQQWMRNKTLTVIL